MPIRAWSHTAADNDDADSASGISLAEGMAPGGLNDSVRAQMAEIAKWEDDTNGSLVAGGTADVITLTTSQTITSLLDGDTFTFRASGTNTTTVTLNVNAIGAKALKHSGGTALAGGDLVSGAIYRATYILASDEFRLHSAPAGLISAWSSASTGASSSGGTLGSASGLLRTKKVGRLVFVHLDLTVSSVGTGSGAIQVTMPATAAATFVLSGRENAVSGKMLQGRITSGGTTLSIYNYDGTFPASNGAQIVVSGVYEAAS